MRIQGGSSSAPLTKEEEAKKRNEERKEKLRQRVLGISSMIPNAPLDLIISACLATRHDDEAIEMVMLNITAAEAAKEPTQTPAQASSSSSITPEVVKVSQEAAQIYDKKTENVVPQPLPVVPVAELKQLQIVEEKVPVQQPTTPSKAEPTGATSTTTASPAGDAKKLEKKIAAIKQILPKMPKATIVEYLELHKGNVDDTLAALATMSEQLQEAIGEVEAMSDDEKPASDGEHEAYVSSDDEKNYVSSGDEMYEVIEVKVVEEEISESTSWFKQALQQQHQFLGYKALQEHEDYKLAMRLQAEEYGSIEAPKAAAVTKSGAKLTIDDVLRTYQGPAEKEPETEEEAENEKLAAIRNLFEETGSTIYRPIYGAGSHAVVRPGQVTSVPAPSTQPEQIVQPTMSPQEIERLVQLKSKFNPAEYWMNYRKTIQDKFKDVKVKNITSVVRPEHLQKFINFWQKEQDGVVLMAFHGTPTRNVPSIIEKGLLIPHSKSHPVGVIHGSALGVGIYLALDPSISVSYCDGGNVMFCCAVVIGKKFHTTQSGQVIVSFNEGQVLPCWTVEFDHPSYRTYNYSSSSSSASASYYSPSTGSYPVKNINRTVAYVTTGKKKQKKAKKKGKH